SNLRPANRRFLQQQSVTRLRRRRSAQHGHANTHQGRNREESAFHEASIDSRKTARNSTGKPGGLPNSAIKNAEGYMETLKTSERGRGHSVRRSRSETFHEGPSYFQGTIDVL